MEDIYNYIVYIFQNYGLVTLIMISIIEVVMFLVKIPYKWLTDKIPNEVVRKIVNKLLIVLVFALSLGAYALGHLWLPQYVDFDGARIISTGAFAVVFYAFGDGIIVKTKASDIDEASKKAADAITKVVTSKKATKEEYKSAADSFKELCEDVTSESKK